MNTQVIVSKKSNAAARNAGVNVAVIAWKSNEGGIGFDWFYSPSAADRVMEIQRAYDADSRDFRRTSVRLDVEVSSYDTAEQEIDAQLEHLLFAEEAIH